MIFDKIFERSNLVYKYEPNQCGNCHEYLNDNDKYCKYCGTKRGERKFLPYRNIMQCIYGPEPKKRVHVCKSCHYRWETMLMIDDQSYCPVCGSSAPIVPDANILPSIKLQIVVDGQSIPVKRFPFVMGREPDVDCCDSDPTVSRKHAEIIYKNDLTFIVDRGSKNGTFLNEERLIPFSEKPIFSGDCIRLGYSKRIYIVHIKVN